MHECHKLVTAARILVGVLAIGDLELGVYTVRGLGRKVIGGGMQHHHRHRRHAPGV
jgi:hypothetical protein